MAELAALLRSEIPEGRHNLTENHTNLERVAEYCEANYFQSDNKRSALEETKNYTTQSLASVAYQINTLAYNFLQLLELQTAQLAEMESEMNHISQTVMIHKEKVARREIGVLTANKSSCRQYKIIAPANPEKPIKYVRKPIDYTILDDIGHGVRSVNTPRLQKQRGSSQGSIQSLGGGMSSNSSSNLVGPAPTTKPPTPPQVTRTGSKVSMSGCGTLGKSSREYRTPPAVAPPQVPSHYAPNYPIGHPRRAESSSSGSGGGSVSGGRGPGYSTLPIANAQAQQNTGGGQQQNSITSPPQVGIVHPMTVQPIQSMNQQQHPQTPPPPPPTVGNNSLYNDHHMPPPPTTMISHEMQSIVNNSANSVTLRHQYNPGSGISSGGSGMSLLHQQRQPVPYGSLGMHTLTHAQASHYRASAAALAAAAAQAQAQRGSLNNASSGANLITGNVGGSQSPPLPPPPPPEHENGEDDEEDEHAAFGRPRTSGVMPIVPDEEDLPGWVPKNYIEKVVAIYDYYADKDDELSFQESSVIYVLKKNDDGWWEGVMDGITGLFPGNYVEPCV